MKIDTLKVRKCLKTFDFSTLFREQLGWDNHNSKLEIPIDGATFTLSGVAQKRGFAAYTCDSIPDRATRLKIDNQVTKSAREHFVIYTDRTAGQQVWQWVRREPGKPMASRDHRFDTSQSGDHLIQRLEQIAIGMQEEEGLTLFDVTGRTRAAFDVDKVTKKFYDRFKKEHDAFSKFIRGIKEKSDLEWYTSLMLNRLMFVYFIQKKGFLDGDNNYLQNRMRMVREQKGQDKFHSFYRYFLLRLFHDGLGKSPDERKLNKELEKLLGTVPYLNGGFFEVHQLEERNTDIDIPDKAFEKLFAFFDEFNWHLDERPLRADNEINPDVVGYIFEKYINQKQMGAYYTKEDITEYISKNTIIPFLFDAAEKKCPIAFKPDSYLWRMLRDNPDRYIYPAVRHGVIRDDQYKPDAQASESRKSLAGAAGLYSHQISGENDNSDIIPLPKNISAGINNVAKRDGWNKSADDSFALPTETWREHVARRTRCLELREKLAAGEVHTINDLITLNLDIWQFARDAIVNSEGPELLRAFWQAIQYVTVLDPTCGSGAFLFAALQILESLYSDCLERMQRFVEDHDRGIPIPDDGNVAMQVREKNPPRATQTSTKKFHDFRKILAEMDNHASERYFVLKSIIINNLFGVDIMEEAVEICKLRLFLKLVAQVDRVEQIEPLPDIDFNIRAGNTLVGYVSLEQIRKSRENERRATETQKMLLDSDSEDELRRIEEDALAVDKAFQQFRAQQTKHGGNVKFEDKQELRKRLEKMDSELNRYLSEEYGITPEKFKETKSSTKEQAFEEGFKKWKSSHQPFHWFVEFYGIMVNGGFDVVVGNPPFVEYSKVSTTYTIREYATESCGNLYAFIFERCDSIVAPLGRCGLIMPLSGFSTERMQPLQQLYQRNWGDLHVSYLAGDANPSRLFDGVKFRLSIVLATRKRGEFVYFATSYLRWYSAERNNLFPRFQYLNCTSLVQPSTFPKLGDATAASVLRKVMGKPVLRDATKARGTSLYYHNCPVNWIRATTFVPSFWSERDGDKTSTQIRELSFENATKRDAACCVINSTLFFLNWLSHSDCYHLTARELFDFSVGIDELVDSHGAQLTELCTALMKDFKKHSRQRTYVYKTTGKVIYDEFYPKLSKAIIDEIDIVLGRHFKLSQLDVDFLVNFDFKYRMGIDRENDD